MGPARPDPSTSATARPPLLAVGLLSTAALGYEVLLVRLLSIAEWHHVVSMVISLALLGYAVSGSVIAIAGDWLTRRFAGVFTLSALAFSLSAPACYLLAQALPFNVLEILWDPWQWAWLALVYLALSVPFFFAATCIALTLSAHPTLVGGIYAADLLGAGAGALAVLMALLLMRPEEALWVMAFLGALAAALATLARPPHRAWTWRGLVALGVLALLVVPTEVLRPSISDYKGLSQMLTVAGSRVVAERSGPHALVTVVANDQVPLRQAAGLSLHSPHLPPKQLAIFEDGEGPTALDRFDGDYDAVRYHSWTPAALGYVLRPGADRILVLGGDIPSELMLAGLHGATRVDALVSDPALITLLTGDLAEFGGWRHQVPSAHLHHASARSYLARTARRYDQVRLRLGGPGAGGAGALREDYTATLEGLQAIWRRLSPDGLIAIGSDAQLPPRLPLKLLETARRALEQLGVEAPADHLALIRGWASTELVVTARPLGADDLRALRDFADSRGFDLAWCPGIGRREVNRHHRLAQPWFYEGAEALLGPERGAYLQRYKFDLQPATDDRPYVFNFFRWQALPELLALRGQGGIGLLEMGYPLLVITVLQALALSLLLILAPLWVLKRGDRQAGPPGGRWRVLAYFAAIGLAFMFIEIAFIQRFILLLGDPVRATAVVVSGFLVFAGLGSLSSSRLRSLTAPPRLIVITVLAIVLVAGGYLLMLPRVGLEISQLSAIPRFATAYLLVAPLAFFMGMPFPLGLGSTALWRPDLVPWAWAINGCASVTGALLATLVAVDSGFTVVVIAAACLYGLASLTFPRAPAGTVQSP